MDLGNIPSNKAEENLAQSNNKQIPGYWIFRGDQRAFLLDEICSKFFDLPFINEWTSELDVLERITLHNVERFYKVMDTKGMGSIIFEDITMIKGSYEGSSFVINGSVLSRFDDGKVKYAVGYLTHVQSALSEFMTHEIAGDVFFSWDQFTNVLKFSVAYHDILGYEYREFKASFNDWIKEIIHPDDIEILDVEQHIIDSPYYGDSFEFCVRLRHRNSNYLWVIGRGIIINRDENGKATNVIGTLSDINLVQDNFENIKQLLYTDTLTGLKNRSYFQHHMARWQHASCYPISVIYADVTGLKITNDVLGHADGDVLLLTVTDILTSTIQRHCDFMRLAGDEFLAIMPNCDEQESKDLLKSLQANVLKHNSNKDVMPIFVGLGRATLGEIAQDTLHACIERADVRMQANKDANRADNYQELKKYLEKRKGRPVSMRDGRRLDYMSPKERDNLHHK